MVCLVKTFYTHRMRTQTSRAHARYFTHSQCVAHARPFTHAQCRTRTLSVLHTHGVSRRYSVLCTHPKCVAHARTVCRTRTHRVSWTRTVLHAHTGGRAHARTGRRAHARRFTHAQCVAHARRSTHAQCTHGVSRTHSTPTCYSTSHTRTTHYVHAQCVTCHAHVLYTQHVTYMSCSQHARTHTIAVYITPGPDAMREVTPPPLATLILFLKNLKLHLSISNFLYFTNLRYSIFFFFSYFSRIRVHVLNQYFLYSHFPRKIKKIGENWLEILNFPQFEKKFLNRFFKLFLSSLSKRGNQDSHFLNTCS